MGTCSFREPLCSRRGASTIRGEGQTVFPAPPAPPHPFLFPLRRLGCSSMLSATVVETVEVLRRRTFTPTLSHAYMGEGDRGAASWCAGALFLEGGVVGVGGG